MITDDMPMVQLVVVVVSALGALNWGLVELAGTNLLVETGISQPLLGYCYLAIGILGAIVLIDIFDDISENGLGSTGFLED